MNLGLLDISCDQSSSDKETDALVLFIWGILSHTF
jgi:hypothetical protein